MSMDDPSKGCTMPELRNVNVDEALAIVSGGALLLDVREDNEWDAGHAADAIHIALSEVPDHLDDLTKDRLIVCVCRSGVRSARAATFLIQNGYDAINLEGGMLAWAEQGEPLTGDVESPSVI
jgi:rhodanese-related sulfurtransferase